MEYNNRVICGIFHVRTNVYENLEYVLGNLTSPLKKIRLHLTVDGLTLLRKHTHRRTKVLLILFKLLYTT